MSAWAAIGLGLCMVPFALACLACWLCGVSMDAMDGWRARTAPREPNDPACVRCAVMVWLLLVSVSVVVLAMALSGPAPAHAKGGPRAGADPVVGEWYYELMQPDTIGPAGGGTSCCGPGEAYWADDITVRDGHVFAAISDDRPDCLPLVGGGEICRTHEVNGTLYEIPPNKYVKDHGNPTGHVIIFLGTVSRETSEIGDETRSKPRPVLCIVLKEGM